MICANGVQMTPKGETGIFFICQLDFNKGNHCKFAKLCIKTQQYETSTDKNGASCSYFSLTKNIAE
jgi:hypothetical protein